METGRTETMDGERSMRGRPDPLFTAHEWGICNYEY